MYVLFFNIFYPLLGVVVLAYLLLLFFTCCEFCAHPYWLFLYGFLVFRMSFEDFCSHFTNATLCHVINTSIFSLSNRWHVFKHNYQWSPGSTAGGCVENRSTFLKNPQVHNIFLWALIYLCVLSFSLFGNWRNVHVFTQSLHFFSVGEPKPCNRHFLFLS